MSSYLDDVKAALSDFVGAAAKDAMADRRFTDEWERVRIDVLIPVFNETASAFNEAGNGLSAVVKPENGTSVTLEVERPGRSGKIKFSPHGRRVFCWIDFDDESEPFDIEHLDREAAEKRTSLFVRRFLKRSADPVPSKPSE